MTNPKLIPVTVWAAARYDPPPSRWVLRRWCRNREIYPKPEKVGKEWYVLATARRLSAESGNRPSLLEQLGAT